MPPKLTITIAQTAALHIMTISQVPSDSSLHLWLQRLSITEVPLVFQIASGLGQLGALLKRKAYFDGGEFKVYPNLSILFIGPPGVGKDTIIYKSRECIAEVDKDFPLFGNTIEAIKARLVDREDPASGFIAVGELTALLGGKDYQKSMVNDLTDILSTNDFLEYGTKAEGTKFIPRPTITLFAGSTEAWLGRSMPPGALEGGFLPRLLLLYATRPRFIRSNPKYEQFGLISASNSAKDAWLSWLRFTVDYYRKGPDREFIITQPALDIYQAWDWTLKSQWPEGAQNYAQRGRAHCHRIAMLMAITCGRFCTEPEDYRFAIALLKEVARTLKDCILPILEKQPRRFN